MLELYPFWFDSTKVSENSDIRKSLGTFVPKGFAVSQRKIAAELRI
jgi:hypothetical protein